MSGLKVIETPLSRMLAVKIASTERSTYQDRKDFAKAIVEDAKSAAIRAMKETGE